MSRDNDLPFFSYINERKINYFIPNKILQRYKNTN